MAVEVSDLVVRHIRDVDDETLKGFTCGREQLDEFLLEEARDYDAHGITPRERGQARFCAFFIGNRNNERQASLLENGPACL